MVPEADAPPPIARRLLLDHELLARLGPETEAAEWEATLRRTGLWELPPTAGEWGRLAQGVRANVQRAQRHGRLVLSGQARQAAVLLAAAGAVVVAAELGPIVGMMALTAPIALGVWWFGAGGRAEEGSAPLVRATALLRQLLQRTIVDTAGEMVVENLPHREYLVLRIHDLEAARQEGEARLADLTGTAQRIRASNRRIGREEEDMEVRQLEAAHAEGATALQRLTAFGADLEARLAALDEQLERMRAHAERRALSYRAARLTDEGEADHTLRTLAEVEVDVLEIESHIGPLSVEHRENEARLRSLLELLTPTSGRRAL